MQLNWHNFQNKELKLAPVRSIFVGFRRFTPHFDENCLMNQNQTIVAKMAMILVGFIMCIK